MRLFMTWQRSMPAWGPLGLLSSDLVFMTWQRESTNLCMLVFSAVFCCFISWQREGASLGTSWAFQQCSAVHEITRWGYQLKDILVFSAIQHSCTSSCSVALECSCFVPLDVKVVSLNDPFILLCYLVNMWCTRGVHMVNTWSTRGEHVMNTC